MFAARIDRLTSSLVRDILAAASKPGVISFAGGLPASEVLFRATPEVLGQLADDIWQYGQTEGEPALREQVAIRARKLGIACSAEQVLIVNGSQQGIDLLSKLMIEEGTPVLTESPTYLAALQVFRLLGARFVTAEQDEEGLLPEAVAAADARLAYLVPTFQNPTGLCYSLARRKALAQAFDGQSMVVFEDDPYRDLSFDGPAPAPIVSHLKQARWVYQGSFSKTLAPGLRLGYLIVHPDLIQAMTRLKQAADLHSNRLSQAIVTQLLKDGSLDQHVASILPLYREKRDVMQAALLTHLGDKASWALPSGGLFFWLTLNHEQDVMQLMQEALEAGLAIMPGSAFDPVPRQTSTIRLNFSHATFEQIEQGIALLGALVK
ncbi:aminotransferase-like domain-containing protein [Janthinobacterium sp. B9-8]|uniref:aminotransferase-like domain-containing protein n=1 Tax=Janthinobacterium sp. B9-8 TaxID=1236179 RepID=UPI00061CFCD3|nr:PLP-dependent aminotransferase family protein [Janthinobacterium sp. B9-8]AMC34425.1 GntR family transcriptional regulator [Janthinobacterium sp. B9-8]